MKVYEGDIKSISIKNIELNTKVIYKSITEKTAYVTLDSKFYENKEGKIISFLYAEELPDMKKAREIAIERYCTEDKLFAACEYVDYDELVQLQLSPEEQEYYENLAKNLEQTKAKSYKKTKSR